MGFVTEGNAISLRIMWLLAKTAAQAVLAVFLLNAGQIRDQRIYIVCVACVIIASLCRHFFHLAAVKRKRHVLDLST